MLAVLLFCLLAYRLKQTIKKLGETMNKSIQIASAFVGLVVGAGFASGQEILQYFTSFGSKGIFGAFVAALAFAFLGSLLAQLGSQLQTDSHKAVMYHIGGRYFGTILDVLITLFLFGFAVVMFAGAGATFQQTLQLNPVIGSLLMVALTIGTLLLNVRSILTVIAAMTPYLMAIVFLILLYAIFTMGISWSEADQLAQQQPAAAGNWLLSAALYVSYNITAGAAILIVMSGTVKDRNIARLGGALGGMMLGVLIIFIHLALFVKIDVIAGVALPTIALANEMHPIVGLLMSVALLAMMYNTAVGMLYTFTVRFVAPTSPLFKPAVMMIGCAGFAASFAGFTNLVGKMYAVMGYVGFLLIAVTLFSWLKRVKSI